MTFNPNVDNPDMLGDAPLSPYTGVPGWLSEHEQAALIVLAQTLYDCLPPMPVIVEIGSEFGQSASLFAKYAPMSEVYCIEINKNAPFEQNLAKKDLFVTPIYQDSAKVTWIEHRRGHSKDIDLLFIDGDHHAEAVKSDLNTFAPYITQGGWLILHDCACSTNKTPHAQHHEVTAALQHWLAESGHEMGFSHYFNVDTLMIFRRM